MKLIEKMIKTTSGEVTQNSWDKVAGELVKVWPNKGFVRSVAFTLGAPQGHIDYRIDLLAERAGRRPVVYRLAKIPFTSQAVPPSQPMKGIVLPNQPAQTASFVGIRWDPVGAQEAYNVMSAMLQDYNEEDDEEEEDDEDEGAYGINKSLIGKPD